MFRSSLCVCSMLTISLFTLGCGGGGTAPSTASSTYDREAELERERMRQAAALAAKRESQARSYAQQAGRQIMDGVGGGRDLVVDQTDWKFDSYAQEHIIKVDVDFNGAFLRNNHYSVSGVLTVAEDGSNPRFSRTYSNENFQKLESRLKWAAGAAAAAIVLNELSKSKE